MASGGMARSAITLILCSLMIASLMLRCNGSSTISPSNSSTVAMTTETDPCVSSQCQNNGTCAKGSDGYNCTCVPGFSGLLCETETDPCVSSPCKNNGSCAKESGGYNCTCVPGFSGHLCETETDPCVSSQCQNNGTCVKGSGGYNCTCVPGFSGHLCETDIDDCASDPCENGGTCHDSVNEYNCTCREYYSGVNCETANHRQKRLAINSYTAGSSKATTSPAKPIDLKITKQTTSSISFRWNQTGPNISSCKVSVNSTSQYNATCNASATTGIISNLPVAGQDYQITLTVSIDNETSSSDSQTWKTRPPDIENVTCIALNTTAVSVNITSTTPSSGNINLYIFTIDSLMSDWKHSDNSSGPNRTRVFGSLNPGVLYNVSAYTQSGDVSSASVFPVQCRTNLEQPGLPNITSTTEVAINLSWNRPAGYFEMFRVKCAGQSGAVSRDENVYMTAMSSIRSGVINATCMNITSGALYSVSLYSSLNGSMDVSPWSPNASATTVPRPPVSVTALPVNATSISVDFSYYTNSSVAQCTDYSVHVTNITSCSSNSTNRTSQISCNSTQLIVSSLTPDCRFNVNVTTISNFSTTQRSVQATGNTAWTIAQPVTNMTSGDITPWSLDVRIAAPPEDDHVLMYVLRVSEITSTPIKLLRQIELRCHNVTDLAKITLVNCGWFGSNATINTTIFESTNCTDNISYNVTDLQPFVQYKIEVIAVNPGGCSDVTNTSLRTSQWHPFCVNQTTIDVSDVKNNSMVLEWAEPAITTGHIKYYVVDYADRCNVTSSEVNVTNANVTLVDLHPFAEYNISVTPWTEVGPSLDKCGTILSDRTRVGAPRTPMDVMVTTINSTALNVTWSLESYRCYANMTYYNVTADGREEDTSSNDVHTTMLIDRCEQDGCQGEHKAHGVVISGLDEYWLYNIIIRAFTEDASVSYTTDSKVESGRTDEWTPGAVRDISVRSLSGDQQCFLAEIQWSQPARRERNGDITGYRVQWTNLDDSRTQEKVYAIGETFSEQLNVTGDNKAYNFTIWASTSKGEGQPSSVTLSSTGSCKPDPFIGGGADVFSNKTVSNVDFDKKKAFITSFKQSLLTENKNGDVAKCGIIVAEDNRNIDNSTDKFDVLFDSFKKWKDVKNEQRIPEYRATPDNWCSTIRNKRKRRSLNEDRDVHYVVGEDPCSSSEDTYCNGHLPSGRSFRVRAIVCTSTGCYVTKYNTDIFVLDPTSPQLWIIGVVLPCILLLIIVGLLIFIWRRMPNMFHCPPKFTTTKSSHPPGKKTSSTASETRPMSFMMPNPILLDHFADEVAEKKRDSQRLFCQEFEALKKFSPQYPVTIAKKPDNAVKNRFTDILPFDKSRVVLSCDKGDSSSDYINASYLTDELANRDFIACQGPLDIQARGVSTIGDFWRLIWQENISVIVMVTRLTENNRVDILSKIIGYAAEQCLMFQHHWLSKYEVKCAKYWPERDEGPVMYGDIQVEHLYQADDGNFWITRKLRVTRNNITRSVTQLHTENWPDFGVPSNVDGFLDYVRHVRAVAGPALSPPIAVHCSAGVGRTGTFIAVDRLLRYMRDTDRVDIMRTILDMREDRSTMVQAECQYIFIHDCIQRAIERGWHRGYSEYVDDEFDHEAIYMNTAPDPVYANMLGYYNGGLSTEEISLATFDGGDERR